MKQRGWIIFYQDDHEQLQAHFEAGGTVEMLDDQHEALSLCCNEFALKCLPIMMKHGAVPNRSTWQDAVDLDRDEWCAAFVAQGFWPSRDLFIEPQIKEPILSKTCVREITRPLCLKSTLYVLMIGKLWKQPWSHLFQIVAKMIWSTRFDPCWLFCLPVSD